MTGRWAWIGVGVALLLVTGAAAGAGSEADRWRAMSAEARRALVVSLLEDRQTWMAEFAQSPDERVRSDADGFLLCDEAEKLVGQADAVATRLDAYYAYSQNACHPPDVIVAIHIDQTCRPYVERVKVERGLAYSPIQRVLGPCE